VASGVISVKTRRLADQGFLGVQSNVQRIGRRRGARVDQLVPDGAAERAGLRRGDLIIQINRRVISDFDDLKRRIETYKALDKIVVKVERPTGDRSAEIIDVEVILSARFVAEQWRRNFDEEKNLLGPPLSAHATGFPLALQHDTVLRANQCGGPLLNIEGQAVGINISRAGRVMSYAIPASEAQKLVRTLIANAEAAE
jgi:S1-C subfamily serine protease